MINVLLVAKLPVVLEGLQMMLQNAEDIRIIGEVQDGLLAMSTVAEYRPQVVLTGLDIPNLHGLEIVRRINSEFPDTAIIVFTSYEAETFLAQAHLAGARGYLPMDTSRELLTHSIRTVHHGGVVISASLGRMIQSLFNVSQNASNKREGEPISPVDVAALLTHREGDALRLLVDGRTNKQIAEALCISEETAKKHVQRIISKLGASDRTQAAVKAVRAGLIP